MYRRSKELPTLTASRKAFVGNLEGRKSFKNFQEGHDRKKCSNFLLDCPPAEEINKIPWSYRYYGSFQFLPIGG